MTKIIFAVLFLTTCSLFNSCKKEAPANTIINPPPSPPPPPPPPPPTNASVFFWTRDSWLTTDPQLYVNINNQTKILDESWGGSGDPGCYPYNGQLKFEMPAGTYTYKTWRQGRDTITGAVIVNNGICNSKQINY